MMIKFNPNLDLQEDAATSIVDLFEGQETCQTNFSTKNLESRLARAKAEL